MAEFIEIIKEDSEVQNEITQTIEKSNKKLYSTPSKREQNALVQNKSLNKQ